MFTYLGPMKIELATHAEINVIFMLTMLVMFCFGHCMLAGVKPKKENIGKIGAISISIIYV